MAYSDSVKVGIDAPKLIGMWIHDPLFPDSTVRNYKYGTVGRAENIDISASSVHYIGRTHPVYNIGANESQEVQVKAAVPYGPEEILAIEEFRTTVRNRRALCYRDGRGRLIYGVMTGVQLSDLPEGTGISSTINTVDYEESVYEAL